MPAAREAYRRRHALQRNLNFALRQSTPSIRDKRRYQVKTSLSRTALIDTEWWASVTTLQGLPIQIQDPELTVVSDGSPTGWGAVLKNHQGTTIDTCHGFYLAHESQRSQNWREATALNNAMIHWTQQIAAVKTISIQTDNKTCLSILKRFGSRHRHLDLALGPTIQMLLQNQVLIHPIHIAGVNNTEADALSRMKTKRNEWMLTQEGFLWLVKKFRIQPTVDAFATERSAKMDRFMSRWWTPKATAINAFAQRWTMEMPYLAPPFNLVGRVIRKWENSGSMKAILLTSHWPTQLWWPMLQRFERVSIPRRFLVDDPTNVASSTSTRFPQMVAWILRRQS
jgi:hypothetical protein